MIDLLLARLARAEEVDEIVWTHRSILVSTPSRTCVHLILLAGQ